MSAEAGNAVAGASKVLVPMLDRADSVEERTAILTALGANADGEAVTTIARSAMSLDGAVRDAALRALVNADTSSAVEALRDVIDGHDAAAAAAAVEALDVDSEAHRPLLELAARDRRELVSAPARAKLGTATESPPTPVDDPGTENVEGADDTSRGDSLEDSAAETP